MRAALSRMRDMDLCPAIGWGPMRVLEPLLNSAKSQRIWSDEESGVTGWEVIPKAGRFFLMLSPEVYRGFSSEGGVTCARVPLVAV